MPEFIKMGVILMIVGAVATAVLALTEMVTREPIQEAKRLEILNALNEVLPEGFNNQPDMDTIQLVDSRLNRKEKPVTFYRARVDESPLGAAFVVTAPDGYSGDIDIMMAVSPKGDITGIQIVAHKETPGLGDKVLAATWRNVFKGKNLDNAKWGVKKDGGEFDQFSGATITPRAIVAAIKKGLEFTKENSGRMFAPAEAPAADANPGT
ncbi:MAG: RnfABCDGE type electron transport complex subunit G [Magnetococcales bacterium]|nr:RnfABCDGE type electron transport complex subunit G [Magnetococcales bacterium]